jgi:acetoin utilization protein AcuB
MKTSDLMSKKLITLSMDAPLSKAKEIFENKNIHHLLIIDEETDTLSGVITDRDLYKHLSPTVGTSQETHRDTALLHKKLHQIMARELITADENLPITKAVMMFYDKHISCLPIVDKQNKLLGIITWRDILKVLALRYRKKLAKS